MKCRSFLALVLVLFSLVFTTAARADDLAAMAGTWTVEAAEAGGKPVASEDLQDLVVTITGDRYTLKTQDEMKGGTLKLDETQKPKTMDATNTEGLDVGTVVEAIYELAGDTLRVCYVLDGSGRPTEMASKEDLPWLVITYKREK